MQKIVKIIKRTTYWIAYAYGCLMVVIGIPFLLARQLEEAHYWSPSWVGWLDFILIITTYISVIIFLAELHKDGVKKGKNPFSF